MANNVIFNVIADTSKYSKGMKVVVSETKGATKLMERAFVGLTATITTSLISFARYETELRKVGKTANLQGKELEDMGEEITKMSERIPISTKKLLELTAASAQIGVKGKKNLVEFTETIAKLTTATNIAGAQGAASIARLLKVVDGGTQNVKLFANVITNLGNNTAATEAEILNMATRVGQATTQFELGITNTLGISAALKDLGFRAEEAGTATGRVFRSLQKAINEGGNALDTLVKVTKMTGQEFKEVFEKDATKAFQIFINALSRLPADQLAQALNNLGLQGDRVNKLLVVLASKNDVLAQSLRLAREEAEKQNALNKEFNLALETLTNAFKFFTTEVVNLATSIGEDLSPEAKKLFKDITNLLKVIRKLNESTGGAVTNSIKLAAKVTLLYLAFTKLDRIIKLTGLSSISLNKALFFFTGGKIIKANANIISLKTSFIALKKAIVATKVSLGTLVAGIFVAVKAGQALGNLIGKLGALKDSETQLKNERKKLIKLAKERFEIQEKLDKASGKRKTELEEELDLITGEIDRKKDLIKVLKGEVEARKNLKDEKRTAREEDKEVKEQEDDDDDVDIEETPEKKKLLSDKALRIQLANEETQRKEKERKQFLKNEKKFGETYAKIEKFYNNERLQGARIAAGELVDLQNSKSKEIAAIGKGAAIFQIVNDTSRGALAAYTGMVSVIPGPAGIAAGIGAAAAITAYGLERLGEVKKNSFAVGTDFVPNDMIAQIHKDEGIIPARQNRFLESGKTALMSADLLRNLVINNTVNNENEDEFQREPTVRVEIGLSDRAEELLTSKQFINQQLGIDR